MPEQPITPTPFIFRLAIETDLEALALMHVQAWREAYRGLMPDAVLDALDPMKREIVWQRTLRQGASVMLALMGDSIVGFMGCGERRHPMLPADGEIYGLYVLEQAQRQGVGRDLFLKGLSVLASQHFSSAALWVFEENTSARRFYEVMGGEICAHRVEERDGWRLSEVAYVWRTMCPPHSSTP